MLEVKGTDAFYGSLQVLWDVSLEVGDETVCLIGPNGHGKTTIINVISGIIPHAVGYIKFNGEYIDKLPPHKIVDRGIVQIPQGDRLFSIMTVRENLLLGAYPSSTWKKRNEKLKTVYELFPILEERKNQIVWTLSGGERRMCSIGRGLMSNAKLLLIDEPSLGLAPFVQLELIEKIEEIRSMGISILLAEQNIRFIKELADRIYVVESGKIYREGNNEEILDDEYLKKVYLGQE